METKEYKLLDGRTIRAKYDRLRMCKISQKNLEAFVEEFNTSYRQAKILETIKKNYALMKADARKKGKWITNPNKMKGAEIECSKCGVSALSKIGIQVCSDYCPSCGAEMESFVCGEMEEEE